MLKIAICDDEQPIREYLKRLVEKCTEGEIRLFVDGGELLADPTAFDLILLDISPMGAEKAISQLLLQHFHFFIKTVGLLL